MCSSDLWSPRLRDAIGSRLAATGDKLEKGLQAVDLGGRLPVWVTLVRLLHWLLLLAAVGGLVWWGVAAVQGSTGDLGKVAGLPLPAALGLGGLVLGLLLSVIGRALVRGLARQRADQADEALRGVVHQVLDSDVVQPLRSELASYTAFRRGVEAARG